MCLCMCCLLCVCVCVRVCVCVDICASVSAMCMHVCVTCKCVRICVVYTHSCFFHVSLCLPMLYITSILYTSLHLKNCVNVLCMYTVFPKKTSQLLFISELYTQCSVFSRAALIRQFLADAMTDREEFVFVYNFMCTSLLGSPS